ncbi:large conductance mechanosensitive channel protein MscL [Candidatus Saccharibacteria bacterium]|nr:large conductance mechanosensitive channel protein MscL [Candidatus Saccharibacteria bacterium]
MKRLKENQFIKEFKTFISQGNVMDLAVGVVIGAAFSAIVTSLVNDIIMPVVSLIGGGADFSTLSVTIPNFFGGDTAAVIRYGNFIQNVVNFLIIAFSLFVVIRFINKLNERAKAAAKRASEKLGLEEEKKAEEKAAEEKKSEDEQTKLLKDILKELKRQGK